MIEIHVKGAFDAGFFAGINDAAITNEYKLFHLKKFLSQYLGKFELVPLHGADHELQFVEMIPQGVTHTIGRPTRIKILDETLFMLWRKEATEFAKVGTFSEFDNSENSRDLIANAISATQFISCHFDIFRTGIIVVYLKFSSSSTNPRELMTIYECFEYSGYGDVLAKTESSGVNRFFELISGSCRNVFSTTDIGELLIRNTKPRRSLAEVEFFGFSGLICYEENDLDLNMEVHGRKLEAFIYVDGLLHFNWWCSFFRRFGPGDVNHNIYYFFEYIDACWVTLKVYESLFVGLISAIAESNKLGARNLTHNNLTEIRSITSNIIFAADVFSYTDHQQINSVIKRIDHFAEFSRRAVKIDSQKNEFVQIITEYQQEKSQKFYNSVNLVLFAVSIISILGLNISLFDYFNTTGVFKFIDREFELSVDAPIAYLMSSTALFMIIVAALFIYIRRRQ